MTKKRPTRGDIVTKKHESNPTRDKTELEALMRLAGTLNKDVGPSGDVQRGVLLKNTGGNTLTIRTASDVEKLKPGQSAMIVAIRITPAKRNLNRGTLPTYPSRLIYLIIESDKGDGRVSIDPTGVDPRLAGGLTVVASVVGADESRFGELLEPVEFDLPGPTTLTVIGIGFSLLPQLFANTTRPHDRARSG